MPEQGQAKKKATGIFVTSLALTSFRSYGKASLEVSREHPFVVLFGRNGAGKTNILEALSFLSPGRGLRRANLNDVRTLKSDTPWAVSAKINTGIEPVSVGTGEDPTGGPRRIIRLDGETLKSQDSLGKFWNVVWLTPQMDRLFIETPGSRRKFLDRLVLGLHPGHGRQVAQYERLMRERNKLLSEHSDNNKWLSAIEKQMAEYATAVTISRSDYASQLAGQLAETDTGDFPKTEIALDGDAENWILGGMRPLEVEEKLAYVWAENRNKDRAAGRTSTGPHKCDLLVRHSSKNIPADQCSTGEQKAMLLSLILGNTRLISKITGRIPILALDEVTAHLDSIRRQSLFDILTKIGGQIWLTGTDSEIFKELSDRASFFNITQGRITSVKR